MQKTQIDQATIKAMKEKYRYILYDPDHEEEFDDLIDAAMTLISAVESE